MRTLTIVVILIVALILDFFWLDASRKRWGWMKGWSNFNKTLFISGVLIAILLIYIRMGVSV